MSIFDKLSGKAKQVAGDITKDPETRRQGLNEERKGEAKEEEFEAQQEAERKQGEVADLERKT